MSSSYTNDDKALTKRTFPPPPPSFSSAPSFSTAPSFSSAPPLPKEDKRRDERKSSRYSDEKKSSRHSDKKERSRHSDEKRSHRHHRDRSPSRHRHRHKASSRRSSRSPHRRTPSPEIVHTGTLNTGLTFVMDRRGDPDILTFGGNHVYSVPAFKRVGGGRVIGLPPYQRIDASENKAGQVVLTHRSNKPSKRYTDSSYAWKELDKSYKRIRIKSTHDVSDPFASCQHTIQLDPIIKQHKVSEQDSYGNQIDYRSLEGNKVKSTQEEEDEEEEEEGAESFNDQIRRRTIEYNRQLDKDPQNASLWLEFVKFQDEAAQGLDPLANHQKNRSSLNEIKLSIFEKALGHNPTNEEILLAYLVCGSETWETIRLLREWDQVLKRHPDSIRLWSEYINVRQTNFASFSFTQCVQVFEDALNVLGRQAQQSHGERKEDIESIMIYISLRACLFMKQSGYQERAFAVIQAMVEFNLFAPSLLNMAHSEGQKMQLFIDFWDSEVPRFGEEGALGWSEYYRMSANGDSLTSLQPGSSKKNKEDEEEEEEVMNLTDWLQAEKTQEEQHRLPLRMSQTEEDELDPFRIPLIEDVRFFLFPITTLGARSHLIYSIFVFLGLPYTPPEVGTNTHFFTDPFTHNEIPLTDFWPQESSKKRHLLWYVDGVPMNPEDRSVIHHPYSIPNSYPIHVHELFATYGTWFKASGKEFVPFALDEQFTRYAFQQLLTVEKSEHLMMCYLAFESSCGYKNGRRLAKGLLKTHDTSFQLWNAYAQMEKSHGRIEEARKVYLVALSMHHTLPKSQLGVPLLYSMFAKLELEDNRPNEALKILLCMPDNRPYDKNTPLPSTTSVLRAREYFTQKIAQLSILSESEDERQAAFYTVVCSALFEYLTSGLEHAETVYLQALDYIKQRQAERGYASEMIWTEYVTLLYRHALSHAYKAGTIRLALEQAMDLFPNNSMFLAFYIWNESKTKIYNRVQHLLQAKSKEATVVLWLCTIYSELHCYQPYRENAVRSQFEKAIEHIKSSVLLWKCFIEFEIKHNHLQRAKSLFYQSIRACPWSKELYLLGIQWLSDTMTEKEKNELISLMMEKEIRIRVEIEQDLLS